MSKQTQIRTLWFAVAFAIIAISSTSLVHALDSDSEQPATLEADDFEIDFKTGVRTYRGNVIFRQGSIKMNCDELVTYLNDDDELDKGICTGNPGRFKQRPEGSEEDMLGQAREITMDQINELVTMQSRAKVTQGDKEISGRTIVYNMVTEKAKIKGGAELNQAPAKTTDSSESEESTESSETENQPETEQTSERPRLVIQPRKKKVVEETTAEEAVEEETTEDKAEATE